jgi:hypothetical protein
MGHATTRAALIYLHKSASRDRAIADALSKMLEEKQAAETDSEDTDGDTDESQEEPRGT